jgi:hypothetical protein
VKVSVCALWLGSLVAGTGAAQAQGSLTKVSPFAASGPTQTTSAVAPEPYRLTGVTQTSAGSRVCIVDAAASHSQWIAVGSTAGGIRVVSYDPTQRRAVISVAGAVHILDLQEWAAAAALPGDTPEAKAREARLLSGDLLDIGLQQRQANAAAPKPAGN